MGSRLGFGSAARFGASGTGSRLGFGSAARFGVSEAALRREPDLDVWAAGSVCWRDVRDVADSDALRLLRVFSVFFWAALAESDNAFS